MTEREAMRAAESVTEGRILDLLAHAAHMARDQGLDAAVGWVWSRMMTPRERLAFDLFLVRVGDELAWKAGSPESRFRERVRRMVATTKSNPRSSRNNPPPIPGEVEEVRYLRGGRHAGPYKHRFRRGVVMLPQANGDVLLTARPRRRLWVRQ